MRRGLAALLAPWLLVLLLLLPAGAVAAPTSALPREAGYRAGIAVRDITPTQANLEAGRTYMGGYGTWKERGPASGIHDPLSARAFCIAEDGGHAGVPARVDVGGVGDRADTGQPLCIVILDSLGLPGPVITRITSLAAAAGGASAAAEGVVSITPERILVGATHTHAAPDLLGLWGGAPDDYHELLVRESAGAVQDALAALQPADLHYAVGTAPAYNRRGWGYTDDALVVLQARSPDGGRVIGTLINFAAHPTVSVSANRELSSDFVHYLRAAFEAGSQAPVVYVNGTIGDVIPNRPGEDYWLQAERYGVMVAAAAAQALTDAVPVGPGLRLARQPLILAVDNFVLRLAQWLGILDDDGISGPPWNRRVSTSVSYLRLGDQLQAVAVPGEALTRLGLDIKAQMTAPAKLLLGQTGGSLGYLIPEDEWRTGRNRDYEESVSLGKEAGALVLAAVAALLQDDPLQADPPQDDLARPPTAGTVDPGHGPTDNTGD